MSRGIVQQARHGTARLGTLVLCSGYGRYRTVVSRGEREPCLLSRDDEDGERDSGTAVVPGTHKHRRQRNRERRSACVLLVSPALGLEGV